MPEGRIMFEEVAEDDPIPGMHTNNALVHDPFKFDEIEIEVED